MTRKQLTQAIKKLLSGLGNTEGWKYLPLVKQIEGLALELWMREVSESPESRLVREQLRLLHGQPGHMVFDEEPEDPDVQRKGRGWFSCDCKE